jgi:hypothetical protein
MPPRSSPAVRRSTSAQENRTSEDRFNLDDPATTLALLKLNAVVGLKGSFNDDGTLNRPRSAPTPCRPNARPRACTARPRSRAWLAHAKGGFWHDGRFPNLEAVVQHYNSCFGLGLTAQQQADLVRYLKSL